MTTNGKAVIILNENLFQLDLIDKWEVKVSKKSVFVKVVSVFLILIALTAILPGCGKKAEETSKINVVTTILPLVDFVENVGGEKVEVTAMIPVGESPHTYAPTPNQMVELSKANMYVKVGSGVEFELVNMPKIKETNKDMLIVDSSKGVELMGKDPHIWLSPRNAKIIVENICDGLVEVDPENKNYYTKNRDDYLEKLDQLDEDIQNGLSGITNRRFMVFHPAWGYFARDYNLEQIPVEKEGKEPTGKAIESLIKQAKEYNIKVIFVSPQFSTKSAKTVAKEIGGTVAYINPLAKDYINNIYTVLDELVQGSK